MRLPSVHLACIAGPGCPDAAAHRNDSIANYDYRARSLEGVGQPWRSHWRFANACV